MLELLRSSTVVSYISDDGKNCAPILLIFLSHSSFLDCTPSPFTKIGFDGLCIGNLVNVVREGKGKKMEHGTCEIVRL